jgi:hypothetical protein
VGVARVHIGEASKRAICAYAARAFELGLADGSHRRRPRSSDGAMLALMAEGDRWPSVFQHTMRAVYLAGFRLARVIRDQPDGEFRLAP